MRKSWLKACSKDRCMGFLRYLLIIFIVVPGMLILSPGEYAKADSSEQHLFLTDEGKKVELNSYIQIFEDEEGSWTINGIHEELSAKEFHPVEKWTPSQGYTNSVYWIKLQITNTSSKERWLLELDNPTMDYVTLYYPEPPGDQTALDEEDMGFADGNYSESSGLQSDLFVSADGFQAFQSGDLYPFQQRDLNHRNFVFTLSLPVNETVPVYLRFETEGAMQMPLTLWRDGAFIEKAQKEYTFLGLFFGLALIMSVYNLFLFFSLKHKSYLHYVIFILLNIMTHLTFTGIGFQYFWPEAVWWNNRAIVFFMCLSNIWAFVFVKNFLDTRSRQPVFDRIFTGLIAFNSIILGLLLFSYPAALRLIMFSLVLTILFILAAAVMSLRSGYRPARFFLLGWCFFLTGVLISSLADIGLIPLTTVTKYAWQGFLSLEVILFSFALADKINIMRSEKEKAEKEAVKSQQLALQSLKKADKLKDEFLAVTSHELRTPLNGIIGLTEATLEERGENLPEKAAENLEMIKVSGKRLAQLIDDILDYSKLSYNALDLDRKEVYLKELTDVVMTICRSLVGNKDVKLINKIPPLIPPVYADENRLQQILYNLIGNAVKYTNAGEITVSAQRIEDYIEMKISDTGTGIPAHKLNTVFLPFSRAEDTSAAGLGKNTEGSGIGLDVTKRLVELHEGEIKAESTQGTGTVFSFTLPIFKVRTSEQVILETAAAAMPKSPMPSQPQERVITTAEQGQIRVLIADDEPVNRHLLKSQLSAKGFWITEAANGVEALEKLRNEPPFDLLIADIMMPKLSGYELCREIRNLYSLTELPVLMLTAKNQIEDRIAAFEMGANDYLVKPCNKQELLARVNTLIELKRSATSVRNYVSRLDMANKKLEKLNNQLEEKVRERTMELTNSNKKLEKVNVELRKLEESKRLLLSSISHELGTPMTFIQGYIQSLQEGIIALDDRRYNELVQNRLNMLERLIQDIFELSRFETGKMTLNIEEVILPDWLDDLFEKYSLMAEEKGIVFTYPEINSLPVKEKVLVYIDKGRMDQVFSNLIGNALKHTEPGGIIELHITVCQGSNHADNGADFDGKVVMELRDNGQGIREEDQPHIFERFYKGTAGREIKGTGLGLAITKEIIEYHKGKIAVESKWGEGSKFIIMLPIVLE
ncbi:ATP-binding protein [Evansella clarkii]|uniref:ATP-binding protein n=1 Tax=Evansella clarkii TaxID=79879 RepID=UPI000B440DA2|nr:ATP-binding protein [Evansella clarkii]